MYIMLSIEDTIKKIESLEIQGAQNIANAGIKAIGKLGDNNYKNKEEFLLDVKNSARKLILARPTEPALRNSMAYLLYDVATSDKDLPLLKQELKEKSKEIRENLEEIKNKISEEASPYVYDNIFTHCHSSTVTNSIINNKRKVNHVYYTETRPMNQGHKTMKDLEGEVRSSLIVDSAAAHFMKECDSVLIGADAVTADGSIVNKIGTLGIAIIAKEYEIPVYCLTSKLKFDPRTMEELEKIEERDPNEIYQGKTSSTVRNPAFDLVPSRYIESIITEDGVIKPQNVNTIMKHLKTEALLGL